MIENSIFMGWFRLLGNWLHVIYEGSVTSRVFRAIADFFVRLFSASSILGFCFKDKDDLAENRKSRILQAIQWLFDLPVRLMRWLDKYLSASVIGKICYFFTDRIAYIYGLVFIVMLCVPHRYWHNTYGLALAVILAVLYLLRCGHNKECRISIIKLDIAFICFVLSLMGAIINPYNISDSFRVFVTDLVPLIIAVILVSDMQSKKQLDVVVGSIIAGVTLASVYGIYQYGTHIPVDELLVDVSVSGALSRLFATMGNPNNYAEILVLTLPLYAYGVYRCQHAALKLGVAALSLLPLINLFYTSSRSGWIGFAFSIFLLVLIMWPKAVPKLILLGAVCTLFLPASITDRLLTIGKDTSSLYRLNIWKYSFQMLGERPITGFGLGPLPYAAAIPKYLASKPAHAHMQILEIWIETGLVGMLTFLWFQLRYIRKVFRLPRESSMKMLSACLLSGLGAVMVVGLFEYVWFYPRVMWFFIIVSALLMAALNIAGKEDIKTL